MATPASYTYRQLARADVLLLKDLLHVGVNRWRTPPPNHITAEAAAGSSASVRYRQPPNTAAAAPGRPISRTVE